MARALCWRRMTWRMRSMACASFIQSSLREVDGQALSKATITKKRHFALVICGLAAFSFTKGTLVMNGLGKKVGEKSGADMRRQLHNHSLARMSQNNVNRIMGAWTDDSHGHGAAALLGQEIAWQGRSLRGNDSVSMILLLGSPGGRLSAEREEGM